MLYSEILAPPRKVSSSRGLSASLRIISNGIIRQIIILFYSKRACACFLIVSEMYIQQPHQFKITHFYIVFNAIAEYDITGI